MRITGPYMRPDGRMHMVITRPDGRKTTKSYPKYLMEQRLGKTLRPNETVDHINRDFTDNSPGNMQVLTQQEHGKIDARIAVYPTGNCKQCGAEVTLTRNMLNRKNRKAGPFCSRSCSGKYGAAVRADKTQTLPPLQCDTPTVYVRLKKIVEEK